MKAQRPQNKPSDSAGSSATSSRRFTWRGPLLLLLGAAALAGGYFAYRSFRPLAEPVQSTSTAAMVSLLRNLRANELRDTSISDDKSAETNRWFVNRPQSIPTLESALKESTMFSAQSRLGLQLVAELLWDGKNEQAIELLSRLGTMVDEGETRIDPKVIRSLRGFISDQLAIAFLRIAEQENCVACQTGESCLFPLKGGGIHNRQDGARAAIDVLQQKLSSEPSDLSSRWLLNLAYMAVGEYPARVPSQWLIPESIFASEYDIKRFPNVARERGVEVFGLAGGSILEDFDGDEHLDLVASGWSLDEPVRYFKNRGNGSFDERTEAAGLKGVVGGLNLSHCDYDNDGHPDFLIIRGGWMGDRGAYPPSLLRNRGGGCFEDVTQQAGLLTSHPGQVGIWGDFDNDGWLDLFLGREDDGKGTHPCQLFHSNRNGTFTDWAPALKLASLGFVKGAAWGDYDNDGFSDLYVSRLGQPNVLYHNDGRQGAGTGPEPWRFTDVTARAGVAEPLFSFPTWFFDYDNDGWLDLFVAGFNKVAVGDVAAQYLGLPHKGEVPRLYHNLRNGTFADVTKEAHLDRVLFTMAANYGDLDNDGFLDFYLGTGAPDLRVLMPNRMFRNAGGKVFQDVTTSGGFGHLQKGHGIAFGDIDRDGDQDIYAVLGGWYTGDGFRNALFLNPGHGNHWITLQLEGVRSNRSAIGARIKLTLPSGSVPPEIHLLAGTGGSFGSSSLAQEIGLGGAASIDSIEITWPVTGKKQVLKSVKVDQFLKVREE